GLRDHALRHCRTSTAVRTVRDGRPRSIQPSWRECGMKHIFGRRTALLSVIALFGSILALSFGAGPSGATTHSSSVALINNKFGSGPNGGWNGGTLPTSGFKDTTYHPSFTDVSADDIADGTIADPLVTFDTAVLYQLGNIGTYLADPDFKSRIESFVFNGGKLIIWDSEMWGED